MNDDGSLLKITEVSKSFGGLKALDGVNLEVKPGQVSLIIGPNGSGKTTLINVVSGVFEPDGGQVLFDSKNITRWPPHKVYSRGLVRTFQIPAPFLSLTVMENMLVADRDTPGESFWRGVLKSRWLGAQRKAQERALRILDLVGLADLWRAPASNLSGGQLKLLETGRALMGGAAMILMDEPVAGVNPTLAHEIFSHILSLRKQLGITFLFIEHRLDIALQYADYVHVFSKGAIISRGSVSDVMNDKNVIKAYLGGA